MKPLPSYISEIFKGQLLHVTSISQYPVNSFSIFKPRLLFENLWFFEISIQSFPMNRIPTVCRVSPWTRVKVKLQMSGYDFKLVTWWRNDVRIGMGKACWMWTWGPTTFEEDTDRITKFKQPILVKQKFFSVDMVVFMPRLHALFCHFHWSHGIAVGYERSWTNLRLEAYDFSPPTVHMLWFITTAL